MPLQAVPIPWMILYTPLVNFTRYPMSQKFPLNTKGQRITATALGVSVNYAGVQASLAAVSSNLMIVNPGPVGVYAISLPQGSPLTVDDSCALILPGTTRVFSKPLDHVTLAVKSAGADQDILIYHGTGD